MQSSKPHTSSKKLPAPSNKASPECEDEEDYLQVGAVVGEKGPDGGVSQRIKYKLEKIMGTGKFGEVWMASEYITGRKARKRTMLQL
jgi:hypothetical protein